MIYVWLRLLYIGSWGSGIFPGGIFFMLAWLLIIALAIYVASRILRTRTPNTDAWCQDRIDSIQILKRDLPTERYLKKSSPK